MLAVLASSVLGGCNQDQAKIPERRPRPVKTTTLLKQAPPGVARVSASVASWKTENVGFEVGGRVEFVAEPNTEIEGRIADKDGRVIMEGTPIGRLESERYQLAVQRAEAEVARAKQNIKAAETELNESIPAQIAAADSSRKLAKIEFERSKRLFERKAGSKGDVDRDKANYESAISQLKQLDAAKSAQQAQIESLKSALLQADQGLRDAQRNLEDCTLYASFPGQIAATSAVPGSVVGAGQPVATLQMMDPIKVELEVSTEQSRRLQQREMLPVFITMPDGSIQTREGYLYLIDPVADPYTRTFTLTLLVMNDKLSQFDEDDQTARTGDIWRLDFDFLPGAANGMLFVEEEALLKDAEGYYLWQITNLTILSRMSSDRMFKVRKLRVTPGPLKIPFLGNWVFQQIEINDSAFDPLVHLVVGKLQVASGEPNDWAGDTVFLDSGGQWMLRPGDLVKVDMSGGNASEGYFVPMDAIVRDQQQTFLCTIESSSEQPAVVKRLPIRIVTESDAYTTSMRRIEPLDESFRLEGVTFVTEGAHYLIDGEKVNVVNSMESGQ